MKKVRRVIHRLRQRLVKHPKKSRAREYLIRLIAREVRRKRHAEAAHREGVDYAYGWIPPHYLLAAGKTFCMRYLTDDEGMCVKEHEIHEMLGGGVDVGFFWEMDNEAAKEGYERGRHDARRALHHKKRLGIPEDVVVYFAADFEATGRQVAPYFRGVEAVIGKRGGSYGSKTVVDYLVKHGILENHAQTYAWSHHEWNEQAHIKQTLISLDGAMLYIHGTPVDYDKTTAIDIGLWLHEESKVEDGIRAR